MWLSKHFGVFFLPKQKHVFVFSCIKQIMSTFQNELFNWKTIIDQAIQCKSQDIHCLSWSVLLIQILMIMQYRLRLNWTNGRMVRQIVLLSSLCIAPCKINLMLEGTKKASLSKLVLLFPVEYFMLYPHSVHYCDKDSLF